MIGLTGVCSAICVGGPYSITEKFDSAVVNNNNSFVVITANFDKNILNFPIIALTAISQYKN